MRRGDVVRTAAEYAALPAGTELVCFDGTVRVIPNHSHHVDDAWLPALVRVVGPVEPEWLEAAARAVRQAAKDTPAGRMSATWVEMARAAVAAADKARGIVNSREELDALDDGVSFVAGYRATEGLHSYMQGLTPWEPNTHGDIIYPAVTFRFDRQPRRESAEPPY